MKSKVSYAVNLLSLFDDKLLGWYRGFIYRSCKALLRIKEKVSTEALLRVSLGKTFEEFIAHEQTMTLQSIIRVFREEEDQE